MFYKENVAGTKWCPEAKVTANGTGSNRDTNGNPIKGTHCLGSICGKWRWLSRDVNEQFGYCGAAGPIPEDVVQISKQELLQEAKATETSKGKSPKISA